MEPVDKMQTETIKRIIEWAGGWNPFRQTHYVTDSHGNRANIKAHIAPIGRANVLVIDSAEIHIGIDRVCNLQSKDAQMLVKELYAQAPKLTFVKEFEAPAHLLPKHCPSTKTTASTTHR